MATRRDRERTRDKGTHETGYDPHDRHQDRRWTAAEERDVRPKRSSGRERRSGAAVEENKEKDDRKDREREKEKEPAWMDTYIPSDSSSGILGGKVANGELDGIQAWKKGMKAKEQRDKDSSDNKDVLTATTDPDGSEQHLDEIQQFRLMMKREEEKKKKEGKIDGDTRLPNSLYGMEKLTSHSTPRDQQKGSFESNTAVRIFNDVHNNQSVNITFRRHHPSLIVYLTSWQRQRPKKFQHRHKLPRGSLILFCRLSSPLLTRLASNL
jgi:hypothetical protein